MTSSVTDQIATAGVLLAGGLSRRMGGGDKAMQPIGGRSILERAIKRLSPQCHPLVLNANGDPARFAACGLPVVADDLDDFPGPLAGILAGLDWVAANRPDVQTVLTASADCPFLPPDLVQRLYLGRSGHKIVIARSAGRDHPVIALWDVDLRHAIRHALTVENLRKVSELIARFDPARVDWPSVPFDPFFNVNTPADLITAERLAALADAP